MPFPPFLTVINDQEGLAPENLERTFNDFISEAHRLKSQYANEIELLVGLETDYITALDLENLTALFERHGDLIDYIIGSLHHVRGIPIDFDHATYLRAVDNCGSDSNNLTTFFESYFDSQYTLITTHHPEVIGHFDLCRLYTPLIEFEQYPSVLPKIERNIRYAIGYGAVFELNAAAFRKGWSTPYPGRDIFEVGSLHSLIEAFTQSLEPR